ncbi:MAG: zinc-binding alcohol dehydrogenase family protein [Chloroflexi bacterium]|nr:zinc-binding alcohol dehydrogenase family protein [Chloroflexota bacterium]
MALSGESMRAIIMENIGKPRVLKVTRIRKPTPAPGQALVKVHATSVNPCDLHLRSGRLIIRKPMPHILGADLAGEIEELADDVQGWQIGDRVFACAEGLGREINGSYAEYCAVPADELIPLPDELDYQSAVAAGASFADAHLALVSIGKLKKADRIVVRGAAGGVGASAIQIARARGAKVIAICRGQFAADLHEIGADVVLEDIGDDLVRQVKVATDERGASLVLHCRDELNLAESLAMLGQGGRLVIAGVLRKPQARLDAMDLYLRNLSIVGSYGAIKRKDVESLLKNLAKGAYKPLVDQVMPLSQARKAHRRMEKEPGFGKIVLAPDSILEAAQKPANWIPID